VKLKREAAKGTQEEEEEEAEKVHVLNFSEMQSEKYEDGARHLERLRPATIITQRGRGNEGKGNVAAIKRMEVITMKVKQHFDYSRS